MEERRVLGLVLSQNMQGIHLWLVKGWVGCGLSVVDFGVEFLLEAILEGLHEVQLCMGLLVGVYQHIPVNRAPMFVMILRPLMLIKFFKKVSILLIDFPLTGFLFLLLQCINLFSNTLFCH